MKKIGIFGIFAFLIAASALKGIIENIMMNPEGFLMLAGTAAASGLLVFILTHIPFGRKRR